MNVATHAFPFPGLTDARAALAVARADAAVDLAGDLAAIWLVGEELERFGRFKVAHARADFLAGRIAAKTALGLLTGNPAPHAWEIRRGIWHQPCLRGPVGGIAVTLAHSGGTSVALAHDDRWRCGIDLEASTREAADVVASQVSPAECAWARAGVDAAETTARWMLLWTAREALGKCLGTGLLFPEALAATEKWTSAENGRWSARLATHDLLVVRALVGRTHVLSWVLPDSAAEAVEIDESLAWLGSALG